jgi:hypothetical protein
MKNIIVIILAPILSACYVNSDNRTPQQKMQDTKVYMVRKEAFMHLCDTNGGVKEYDDHASCGRYCSRSLIVCNNGLSASFKY